MIYVCIQNMCHHVLCHLGVFKFLGEGIYIVLLTAGSILWADHLHSKSLAVLRTYYKIIWILDLTFFRRENSKAESCTPDCHFERYYFEHVIKDLAGVA